MIGWFVVPSLFFTHSLSCPQSQTVVEMDNRTRNRVMKKEKKAEERLAKERATDEYFRSQIDTEVVMYHHDPDDAGRWGGDIHLENLQIAVAGKTLIDNCNIMLQRGRRYGLVGR